MKKSGTKILTLLVATIFSLYGCSGKNSDHAEGGAAEDASGQELASPLRTSEGKIGDVEVNIQYGSPSVRERVIWGGLEPYDEVWRTGANEATFVEFSDDVTVEGKELEAGKYSLFTIPRENGPWVVIFNSEWDLEHGHYQYKESNDVLRVEVEPQWEASSQESLSVTVEDEGIVVRWEKLKLPIQVN